MEQGPRSYVVTADGPQSDLQRDALLAAADKRGMDIVLPGTAALAKSNITGAELRTAPFPNLELPAIAKVWLHGSVVRSWLLELLADALGKDPRLEHVQGYVEDSGEGRWTVQAAIDQNVPAPVITLSLLERIASRQRESFNAKVQAALRNEFGGHEVKKA